MTENCRLYRCIALAGARELLYCRIYRCIALAGAHTPEVLHIYIRPVFQYPVPRKESLLQIRIIPVYSGDIPAGISPYRPHSSCP